MKNLNNFLLINILIIVIGLVLLLARPCGMDITYGIITIAVGFAASVILAGCRK